MNMYLPPGRRSGTTNEMSEEQQNVPSAGARALLIALKLRGVGPAAVRKLAAKIQDGDDIEPTEMWFSGHGLITGSEPLAEAADAALKIIDACRQEGIFILSMLDSAYPGRLKAVSDAPPILYVKGDLAALRGPICAVVGTRHASDYGLKIAYKSSKLLCMQGVSVISGLALGIDTAAHEGALATDGVTIAVMAHGLDTVAPTSNKKLAARILNQGGALVSEHEPKVPPRPAEFVRRNRIQSGIALCSVIVETGEVGGTMHQARFTRDQHKPVLAILPEDQNGTVEGFTYDGGRLLVRDHGAIPIRDSKELLKTIVKLAGDISAPLSRQDGFGF